jgi:hypothetical protein
MTTTTLAVVAIDDALGLPSGPMSDSERQDRDNHHHKIKACSEGIGAALSHIYNKRLFRGDDGRQGWEDYIRTELPNWLDDAPSIRAADRQRMLYEAKSLLASKCGGQLPATTGQVDALCSLIPRHDFRHGETGGSWYPAILDDPDAAEGIAKVWELACRNADDNQRRNGPTAEDVRAAREELRPALEQQGLIRSAPAAFQAATVARVEAARQRTVNVTPANAERFKETMANIRDTKADRTAKVEVDHVREQLDAAEHQRLHELQEEVRGYSSNLIAASKAIHGLLGYLQSLSRIHGTQLLDEMRRTDFMGLVTVSDDMQRLQEMGQELMQAVNLARSSDPPTGINAQTIEV